MSSLDMDYRKLTWLERQELREEYMRIQNNECFYCGSDLRKEVPTELTDIPIDWSLFPTNFLQYPVHLQHNHQTGMTEGAVHSFCNALMWNYERR